MCVLRRLLFLASTRKMDNPIPLRRLPRDLRLPENSSPLNQTIAPPLQISSSKSQPSQLFSHFSHFSHFSFSAFQLFSFSAFQHFSFSAFQLFSFSAFQHFSIYPYLPSA